MKKTIKKYANKVIFSNKYDNYLNKEIIGREYIKEIIYVPRYQGLSSTKIISGAHN